MIPTKTPNIDRNLSDQNFRAQPLNTISTIQTLCKHGTVSCSNVDRHGNWPQNMSSYGLLYLVLRYHGCMAHRPHELHGTLLVVTGRVPRQSHYTHKTVSPYYTITICTKYICTTYIIKHNQPSSKWLLIVWTVFTHQCDEWLQQLQCSQRSALSVTTRRRGAQKHEQFNWLHEGEAMDLRNIQPNAY